MASALTKFPVYRTVASRTYAQAAPLAGLPEYDLKNTTLPSKLVVTSAENESPISRISIVVRAGSRNESDDNLGVSHILRLAAGLSTKNASQFAIIRNIQQVGANLTASNDRELVTYTLEGTRGAIEKSLPFLTEVVTQQVFKPWEVAELVGRQRLERATRPLQVRAVELLHKAAFRSGGLSHSIYSPKHRIGKISNETLQHYVAEHFLTGRTAVIGLGVDHAELVQYAQSLSLETGEGCTAPSPYKGGSVYSEKGGNLTYVAVAGEGGALRDPKQSLAFAILQKAIAAGPQVKWSSNDNGALAKALGTGAPSYVASAINANYTDTGLFGVLLATQPQNAGKVVEAAVKTLKAADLSDAQVQRAKNLLKIELLSTLESGARAVEEYGVQAAIRGAAQGPKEVAAAVDAVTTADVTAAYRKVGGSNLSLAAIGDLRTVPYLDDLKA